ncbi:N-6 DNA methylase [Mesobacillus jeotgali]|uniref:N-6 DNA methylase n=1 Tax=Mesobacillus jeotgali TaxID=129985 RepID=UPI001CFCC012|nr:N-6 DNA methylase [Mesobacillus jeotgali]
MTRRSGNAESRSRAYTRQELLDLEWNVKHPTRGGDVLEEQEARGFDERYEELLGQDRPDFLLLINNEPKLIIENKNELSKLDEAFTQAKDYAEKLSRNHFNIRVITAVAGDDEQGVIVRNYFRNDAGTWEVVQANGFPLTQILRKSQLEQLLLNNRPSLDIEIPTEDEFYKIASKINKILHEAKVNKNDRAAYLAAIVLAIKEGDISLNPNLIINHINTNVRVALERYGKQDLINTLRINGQSAKLKNSLPIVFHNLDRLNIRALMNTGADILGKFFESFLRYGNDAKDLGIVFTPRHIVKFMCDLVDIEVDDVVYDPACGTGGFLVEAFTRMKESAGNNARLLNDIKSNRIFGYDSDDSGKIPALAVVNMIFRGDGRSNIYNRSCFENPNERFATKVLINPPYAQDEAESAFIEHGLNALQPNKYMAAIIPYAILCKSSLKAWREELLLHHTVKAVFTMPGELFYPTNINTCVVILQAHVPHRNKKIFFCRIDKDGYKLKKKKRIEFGTSQLQDALEKYKGPESINVNGQMQVLLKEVPGFSCYRTLDPDDTNVELVPEKYLEDRAYSNEETQDQVEKLLRSFVAFNINYEKELQRTLTEVDEDDNDNN